MERQDLERMTREQLIAQAERLGIPRPRVLTQPELVDEIIGRTTKNDRERAKARGWLGRARDLLASVVERGLHLPEAARVLRKGGDDKGWPAPPPPLPTVTLAEIYAAQGHLERALAVLDEVIAREPDHREARLMRERFAEQAHRSRARSGRDREPPSTQEAPPQIDETPPAGEGEKVEKLEKKEEAPVPAAVDPAATSEKDAPPSLEEVIPVTAKAPEAPLGTASARIVIDAPRLVVPVRLAEKPASSVEAEGPVTAASATIGIAPEPAALEAEPAAVEVAPAAPVSDLGVASTDPPPAAPPASGLPPALPLVEEPQLPDRYEVDEIVAIAVDPRTLYLYWEVRPTTLAHARAGHPDGWLCVRVASVTASWEGPTVDTRDLRVDALYGDRFVRDVQPGSNVRVSVGWRSDEGFDPFAVGSEVTAPRAVPVETIAQEVARWEAAPTVAPFQNPRGEVFREEARRWSATATASPAGFATRTRASARGLGAPVDTGVALWGAPPIDEVPDREELIDEAPIMEELAGWFDPGGSSELGRGGPVRRVRPVRGRRVVSRIAGWTEAPGGASELSRGAGSGLGR